MVKTFETCTEGSEKSRKLNPMMSQVIERSRRIRIKKRPFCLDIKRLVDSGWEVLVAQWRQELCLLDELANKNFLSTSPCTKLGGPNRYGTRWKGIENGSYSPALEEPSISLRNFKRNSHEKFNTNYVILQNWSFPTYNRLRYIHILPSSKEA